MQFNNLNMQVPYEVKFINQLKGRGLIALQPIKKGTLVYDGTSVGKTYFNSREDFENWAIGKSKKEIENALSFSYGTSGRIALLKVPMFINHSSSPNVKSVDPLFDLTYAIRDIDAGEEICEDYSTWDQIDWFDELCNDYQNLGYHQVALLYK